MPKVIVVNEKRLLGAALLSLLQTERDLELFGLTPSSTAELLGQVRQLGPDIIILDTLTFLNESIRHLLSRFKADFHLRVLIVDGDENLVNLFGVEPVVIKQSSDLADLIRTIQVRASFGHPASKRSDRNRKRS